MRDAARSFILLFYIHIYRQHNPIYYSEKIHMVRTFTHSYEYNNVGAQVSARFGQVISSFDRIFELFE